MDLKFPHHESEIAQARALSGKRNFVALWVHTGFLTVNGEKMSKSLKNFVTIRDFLKGYSPQVLRMFVLSRHYRSPIDYSDPYLGQQEQSLQDLSKFCAKLTVVTKRRVGKKEIENTAASAGVTEAVAIMQKEFRVALEDDFNTPQAIAAVFTCIKKIQPGVWLLSPTAAAEILAALSDIIKLFGLELVKPNISKNIIELTKTREHFRKRKDFVESDKLRKQISSLGYVVEDAPSGPFLWPDAYRSTTLHADQ